MSIILSSEVYVFSLIASYYTEIVFSVAVWVADKGENEEVC